MSLLSYLREAQAALFPSQKKRPSSRSFTSSLGFETLEPRQLLAGIFFDSATGDLTIFGDDGNNTGQLDAVGSQYRARVDGADDQSFPISQVSRLVFIGGDGNDTFVNGTNLVSFLYGNAGNDTLTGGGGVDNIFGDVGNDTIDGQGGDDVIIGDLGDDVIAGGDGNDHITAGEGNNKVKGQNGNDRIFGGNGNDRVEGNDGVDGIFLTGGDNYVLTGDGGTYNAEGRDIDTQADLVVTGDGDDTVIGGGGWDVVFAYGGNDMLTGESNANSALLGLDGDDTIRGGNKNDYLAGGAGVDTIIGRGGSDSIFGDAGNDSIVGGSGVDYIRGGTGDDTIDGEGGNDIVFYKTNYSTGNYKITGQDGLLKVAVSGNSEGTDIVRSASFMSFDNGSARDAKINATNQITIQPIIVSNNNGQNTSNFFGTDAQEEFIKFAVDDVYLQADIDINWLSARSWNNTFANVGSGGTRGLLSELDTIVAQGDSANVNNSNRSVINMYFIRKPLGTNGSTIPRGLSYANLPGFSVGNGVAIHIPDSFLGDDSNLLPLGHVSAHEIAHNLGLDHVNSSNNLMFGGAIASGNLTSSQSNTIRASGFTKPTV